MKNFYLLFFVKFNIFGLTVSFEDGQKYREAAISYWGGSCLYPLSASPNWCTGKNPVITIVDTVVKTGGHADDANFLGGFLHKNDPLQNFFFLRINCISIKKFQEIILFSLKNTYCYILSIFGPIRGRGAYDHLPPLLSMLVARDTPLPPKENEKNKQSTILLN